MSNPNFWNDEDFSENPVQYTGNGQWKDNETYTPAPENLLRAQELAKAQKELQKQELNIDEIAEEVAESAEGEEDFSEVLSDARLRLEQGRLYEMVMQHDLFKDLDADPRAVKSVQGQIRRFAKERMEIMLGIKKETAITERLEIDFPFNAMEVEFLKNVVKKATNGASEQSDNYVPEIKRITEELPVVSKKQALNSIGPVKSQKTQPKALVKKAEPIKREPKQDLPKELELDYNPLEKDPNLMNAAELAQRNEEAARRQAGRKATIPPSERLPWPSQGQQQMLAMQQAQRASEGFVNNLAAKIKSKARG